MKINIIYLIIQGKRRRNTNVLQQGGGSSSSAMIITLIGFRRKKGRWPSGPSILMKAILIPSTWSTRNNGLSMGDNNIKLILEKNEKVQNPQSCIWETKGRRHSAFSRFPSGSYSPIWFPCRGIVVHFIYFFGV